MCGLFGWQLKDKVNPSRLAIISTVLSIENDRRGGDSWGFYAPLEKDTSRRYRRGIGDISKSSMLEMSRHASIICHTRKMTTGKVKIKNCHPFLLKTLVGAHNGIVQNQWDLNKQYHRNCRVDSLHIFHHLENKLPLKEIEAYGAVEFLRLAEPDRIWLSRFNSGQLNLFRTDIGCFWSSESGALRKALKMADIDGEDIDIKEGKTYFVNGGQIWEEEDFPFDCFRVYTTTNTNTTKHSTGSSKRDEQVYHGPYGGDGHYSDKNDKSGSDSKNTSVAGDKSFFAGSHTDKRKGETNTNSGAESTSVLCNRDATYTATLAQEEIVEQELKRFHKLYQLFQLGQITEDEMQDLLKLKELHNDRIFVDMEKLEVVT